MNDNSKLFAKLKELNELKEQNLISAELYEQKRKEILGRISVPQYRENPIEPNYYVPSVYYDKPDKSNFGLIMVIIIIAIVIVLIGALTI